LVFHSSTIAMMHGPINIRITADLALLNHNCWFSSFAAYCKRRKWIYWWCKVL